MLMRIPAAIALTVCLSLPVAAQETTADTVVATVNGTDITLGHMIVAKERLPDQFRQLPDDVLFDALLNQLIQQAAVAANGGELSKRGQLALEYERRALIVSEVVDALTADVVNDAALQAAYDETYANLEPEDEFNAAHILVETEEEAQALLEELNAGADFGALAREHSTGPSGPNGGDLGWFGKGMMVPPFEEAVLALQAGEVGGPVQTQFGWHLVRLNETRKKGAPPFEEVRGELAQQIQRTAVEALLDEATEAAEITRIEAGTIDPNLLSDTTLLDE